MTDQDLYQTNRRLADTIRRRNCHIRHIRRKLMELFDVLGDSHVTPPLPEELQKWARKEISKL